MNPHVRVHTGPTLEEGRLREAIRSGRVTVADWPENWIELVVVGPNGARAEVGEELVVSEGSSVEVRVTGYGAAEAYSGAPELRLEWGRVAIPAVPRKVRALPLPVGDFAANETIELGPGRWVLAARVVPTNPLRHFWRGVQLTNPVRVEIGSSVSAEERTQE